MPASHLPQGARGDVQPAMQRRLAQLHSAMGSGGDTPLSARGTTTALSPQSPGAGTLDARVTSRVPLPAKPLVLMGGLLLLGLMAGALSQRQSAASEMAERPPSEAVQARSPALPPVTAAPATAPSEDDAIRDTLERWRLDWSRRDVAAYLDHYSARFEPATGISRSEWAKQRQQALLHRPAIRIELQDLRIERPNPQEARVRFLQTYLSGRYQENAQPKTMRLLREEGGWRIAGEWQGTGPAQTQPKP